MENDQGSHWEGYVPRFDVLRRFGPLRGGWNLNHNSLVRGISELLYNNQNKQIPIQNSRFLFKQSNVLYIIYQTEVVMLPFRKKMSSKVKKNKNNTLWIFNLLPGVTLFEHMVMLLVNLLTCGKFKQFFPLNLTHKFELNTSSFSSCFFCK